MTTRSLDCARDDNPGTLQVCANRWILALLAVSSLLYLAFFAFRPLSQGVLHETGVTPSAGGFFYATVVILLVEWVLYAVCLRWMASGGPSTKTLLLWSVSLAFCVSLVWPVVSSDHFQYLSHGRIFALYHENPLTVPYQTFGHDPLYKDLMTDWAVFPSSYGPIAILVSSLPAWVGGDSLWAGLYFSKFIYFLFFAAALVIFYCKAPDARSFYLFAFNPLLLSELLISAHNDLLMVFFMALGWLFLDGDRSMKKACLIFVFWSMALFVKITPILLMPFLWVYLVARLDTAKRRILFAGLSILLFALLFGVLYLPFWEGAKTLGFPFINFSVLAACGKTFPTMLVQLVMLLLGNPSPEKVVLVQRVALGVLFVGLVALFVRYLRDVFNDKKETVFIYLALAYVLFLLLSPSYVPWYICLGIFVWCMAGCSKGMTYKTSAYLTVAFSLMGILDYLTLR